MCGRFTERSEPKKLAARFGVERSLCEPTPRYNIAPSQRIAIVIIDGGRRTLAPAVWGLVPRWSSDPGTSGIINARAETVHTKPPFREAFGKRRCLVPADGFYEWRKDARGKTPMFICLADGGLFAFAGVWEPPPAGADASAPPTCAIITTEPNPLLAAIHNRMPAILDPADEAAWIGRRDAAGDAPPLRSRADDRPPRQPACQLSGGR